MKRTSSPKGYLPPGGTGERSLLTESQAARARLSYGTPVIPPTPKGRHGHRRRRVRQERNRLFMAACGAMLLGLILAMVPLAVHVLDRPGEGFSVKLLGISLGQGFLSQGLPPVNQPFFPEGGDTETYEKETVPDAPSEETEAAPDTEAETNPSDPSAETTPDTREEGESKVEEPMAGLPVVYADMSKWQLGVDHIQWDASLTLPMPTVKKPSFSSETTVLILHSHPYATYGDGSDRVPLGTDRWAVEVPEAGGYPAQGVVTLGERLTVLLRLRGIRVIHGLLPEDRSLSHMDTYERTKSLVADMCAAYPEIGLIIDIRRGADKLPDGSLLRTLGSYRDKDAAQVKIVVDGLRPEECWQADLSAAVILRRSLYQTSPTLSRPVYVARGEGLGAQEIVMMTLEFGTAGNTFEEAAVLLTPVADAIASLFP